MLNKKFLMIVMACGLFVFNACSKMADNSYAPIVASTHAVSQQNKKMATSYSRKDTKSITTSKAVEKTEYFEDVKPNNSVIGTKASAANKPVSVANKPITVKKHVVVNKNSSDDVNSYIPYILIGLLILIVAIFYIKKGK